MSDDKKEPVLLDHNYDGIQEYDNPLPNWWLFTFLGAIIFSAIYYIHYDISGAGPSLMDEFKASMVQLEATSQKGDHGGGQSEESLAAFFNEEGSSALGKEVFGAKCASCHGPKGEGLIGPNLTDNFWIHGNGTRMAILSVVRAGVLEKGMPNWDSMLKENEILAVTGHVFALRGSHPEHAKEAQGVEVK